MLRIYKFILMWFIYIKNFPNTVTENIGTLELVRDIEKNILFKYCVSWFHITHW
jgi:hypothetical protein